MRVAIPASRITALRFISERVGWAGAFVDRDVPQVACHQAAPGARPCRGVVLRTEDGGRTWQETLSIATDGVLGDPVLQLQASDADHAWALTLAASPCSADCPNELRRTTDGGKTWTNLLRGRIDAIRFATSSDGWLALHDPAGAVEVRATNDGGTTWVSQLHVTSGAAVGLDAATSQTAWLMTRDGAYCTASSCLKYELFRTNDGGVHWSNLGNPKEHAGSCGFGHLIGPLFASTTRGWMALSLGAGGVLGGPGGLLVTEDGGATWRCQSTPPNTRLISAADPLHVWLTSEDRSGDATLYASDDGGESWHKLDLTALRREVSDLVAPLTGK